MGGRWLSLAATWLHPSVPPPAQLLTFLNAFTLLSDANRLAVFAAGAGGCHLAFCSPSCQPAPAAAAAPGGHAPADPWPPSAAILRGLQRATEAVAAAAQQDGGGGGGGLASCQLSSALSRALCFIHSMQRRAAAAQGALLGGSSGGAPPPAERQQPARLLCLSAAPDVPSQYIGIMNAIFSAQVGCAPLCCTFCCICCCRAGLQGSGMWRAVLAAVQRVLTPSSGAAEAAAWTAAAPVQASATPSLPSSAPCRSGAAS